MSKPKVAVLMGGPSREHDVSLKSGKAITTQLRQNEYSVYEVFISLTQHWIIDDEKPQDSISAIETLKKKGVELVFLALHGSFGEDGSIQALLEKLGVRFTGSGSTASLLAMDKITSGELFRANGLYTPKGITFTRYEFIKDFELGTSIDRLGYPLIVKPASQGSSLGVSLVDSKEDVFGAIEFALEHDNKIIVQEHIKGREVSCGVLENPKTSKAQPLPPTELIPVDADFFDYHAKYTRGATNEVTPPNLPDKTIKNIQDIALQAHTVLDCQGYSRTDLILAKNKLYVIETNTLPGMTDTSILPQQAAAAGISFGDMLEQIITVALKKRV